MAHTSDIDVRDLKSVRAATARTDRNPDVVLGDDWVAPDSHVDTETRRNRNKRGFISIRRSPLARKIVMLNIIALMVFVVGVLYMNPSRDSLAYQRKTTLVNEAQLIATIVASQIVEPDLKTAHQGSASSIQEVLKNLNLRDGATIQIFDTHGALISEVKGRSYETYHDITGLEQNLNGTALTDMLNWIWSAISGLYDASPEPKQPVGTTSERISALIQETSNGATHVHTRRSPIGSIIFVAATPVIKHDTIIGAVSVTTASGEIDLLVRQEREQILRVFVIALFVSIFLSLVLAAAIANPISDLANVAELGRVRNAQAKATGRIRIPDLTGRPDEIGRLSGALRGMVSALYDRIDTNEQFAADVAHEIKNPLASLRSAIGTMRVAKRDDQREKLLDVVEHDVRRLDRLVSDIANASRLDSELVKEDEETFNLIYMLSNLTQYLGQDAEKRGIEFIEDLPNTPLMMDGLEARLAQVFVNLITNAMSFCEDGDVIRVWCRKRDDRVLVVVEDTGPGIPDEALAKIFQRFYSERPEGQFGNNSGLGLAISKQIIEAHGGVIWAENIRNTDSDPGSDPIGARFVVGLPI